VQVGDQDADEREHDQAQQRAGQDVAGEAVAVEEHDQAGLEQAHRDGDEPEQRGCTNFTRLDIGHTPSLLAPGGPNHSERPHSSWWG